MKIDGGSLFYVYSFLKSLNDNPNINLINFRISKEDLVLKKTFYENYNSYTFFYEKHLEILRYRPFCETGAYYRLNQYKIEITNPLTKDVSVLSVYIDKNNIKYQFNTNSSADLISNILDQTKLFLPKLEYVIKVRKARYVDPCFVDDNYIDENYL